ncbi:MAG: 16S rRNA (uracil(1498)-N(3))-methyltransferase [Pseudomonadota bacterium]
MTTKIRLYVNHPLGPGQMVLLPPAQAHYLFGVMRLTVGGAVALFNGRDGEWRARVVEAGRKKGTLRVEAQTGPLRMPPDLWLFFAPIKKARTAFIVEKATEMGVARICPVQTDFTNAGRFRHDSLQAHAVEAAEQCGGTFVPTVAAPQRLDRVLDRWPVERRLMFCDEALSDHSAGLAALLPAADRPAAPWAILIGPEGGFSTVERERLRGLEHVVSVSLGPRILRADTAVVAAMTLWQQALGDWR